MCMTEPGGRHRRARHGDARAARRRRLRARRPQDVHHQRRRRRAHARRRVRRLRDAPASARSRVPRREGHARASALGQKWKDKLGMRASLHRRARLRRLRVPVANLLGEEGEGTLTMMRNLEIERLTLAAMSLGIAQRCARRDGRLRERAQELRRAAPRARPDPALHRREFAEYRAARALVYDTARRLDLARDGPARRRRRREAVRVARSASASPTPRSRCSAATATWASTWSSGSGATPSCSRSAAARSRRTRRTSPRISRAIRALVR